jgi:hypothetical protein
MGATPLAASSGSEIVPLCDVLSVWILPSGRRYDFWKKQKKQMPN